MKVFNIRQGFATNSSSSHSILVLKDDTPVLDKVQRGGFGWDYFTASSQSTKEDYFASVIHENLVQVGYSNKKAKEFMLDFFGIKDKDRKLPNYTRGVDHQSVWALPRTWDGKGLNMEFLNDLKEYISRNNVVIAGGNDNDSEVHPLEVKSNKSSMNKIYREADTDFLIARKDDSHWVLFDRSKGNKVRISFDDIDSPDRAATPELVDIKITDFCPFDCDFCYQSSTIDGKHSSLETMKKIADELSKAKVFEVALGGGETTLHPDFVEILKIFHEKQIVPNFTTKNMNFFKSEYAKEITDIAGGIAFSVQSVEDIKKIRLSLIDFEDKDKIQLSQYDDRYNIDQIDKKKPWAVKINFQIVMGVMKEKEFELMLKEIADMSSRVTLLGYKDVGRGQDFAPYKYNNWLDIVEKIQKKNSIKISIDTALAAEFNNELQARGVDSRTYHINEGNFSAYIDAVEKFIAPSSYGGLEQKKVFDDNWLSSWNDMTYTPTFKKTIKIGSM